MIELIIKHTRTNDVLNSVYFIYKLAASLNLELGINSGIFISKCQCYGTIKVLKNLGLYKTIGKGETKKVLVDEKLNLIINTTVNSNEIISKTLIEMIQGKYIGLKFGEIDIEKYNELEEFLIINSLGNYNTYIMFNPLNNLYKIGRSKNVMQRLEQIKCEFTNEIYLVSYLDNDIESILHFELREFNSFGEWFNIDSDKVLDIMNKYNFLFVPISNY